MDKALQGCGYAALSLCGSVLTVPICISIYLKKYRNIRDVIEICSIPTVDEFNAKVWGEGFYATIISKEEFDEIWNTRNYGGSLDAI